MAVVDKGLSDREVADETTDREISKEAVDGDCDFDVKVTPKITSEVDCPANVLDSTAIELWKELIETVRELKHELITVEVAGTEVSGSEAKLEFIENESPEDPTDKVWEMRSEFVAICEFSGTLIDAVPEIVELTGVCNKVLEETRVDDCERGGVVANGRDVAAAPNEAVSDRVKPDEDSDTTSDKAERLGLIVGGRKETKLVDSESGIEPIELVVGIVEPMKVCIETPELPMELNCESDVGLIISCPRYLESLRSATTFLICLKTSIADSRMQFDGGSEIVDSLEEAIDIGRETIEEVASITLIESEVVFGHYEAVRHQ